MDHSTLYVSDLDGTLLDANGYLSEVSRERLIGLLSEGLAFTVASARSLVSMRERLGDLPFRLPVVEFNGAYVSDYHSGEKLITNQIESDMVSGIQQVMREQEVVYFVSSHDGQEDHVYHTEERYGGMDYYLTERQEAADPRLRLTTDWSEIENEDVVCFTAVDSQEPMVRLRDALAERYGDVLTMHLWDDTYATGWYWLMVHHRDACKGKAIQSLMEAAGINAHQLTVFGDQVNDLGMLEMADRKISVANACPEVLDRSDLVLKSHTHDSVTEYILEDWQRTRALL